MAGSKTQQNKYQSANKDGKMHLNSSELSDSAGKSQKKKKKIVFLNPCE